MNWYKEKFAQKRKNLPPSEIDLTEKELDKLLNEERMLNEVDRQEELDQILEKVLEEEADEK